MDNLRVALAGLGGKGLRGWMDGVIDKRLTHAGAVLETKGLELCAVCDVDEALLARSVEFLSCFKPVHGYSDYDLMLTREEPDAVIISTPTQTHIPMARQAMRYRRTKAILLEKPVAATIEEATLLKEDQFVFKVPVIVNHTRRWHSAWKQAASLVKDHGGCLHAIGVANGETLDCGCHMYDVFNMVAPGAKQTYIDLYEADKGKYWPGVVFEASFFCRDGAVCVEQNGREVASAVYRQVPRYKNLRELIYAPSMSFPTDEDWDSQLRCEEELRDVALGLKAPSCSLDDGVQAIGGVLRHIKEAKA